MSSPASEREARAREGDPISAASAALNESAWETPLPNRIDIESLPIHAGTFYPPPFDQPCRARERKRLGDAAGLTQFGINQLRLPPGAWSSQRHWHIKSDEFVCVLSGEVVLVTDSGEEILTPGDCAGFKAGDSNGHHFQNRSQQDAILLEIGTRVAGDGAFYPDIDLVHPPDAKPAMYTHRDGTPYPDIKRHTS